MAQRYDIVVKRLKKLNKGILRTQMKSMDRSECNYSCGIISPNEGVKCCRDSCSEIHF